MDASFESNVNVNTEDDVFSIDPARKDAAEKELAEFMDAWVKKYVYTNFWYVEY